MTLDECQPEVRVLEDGKIGYFYNLTQMETIRDIKLRNMSIEEVFKSYTHIQSQLNKFRS